MKHALILAIAAASLGAQTSAPLNDSLRIYYVGKAVGWERYSLTREGDSVRYTADLEYIDRGRPVRMPANATYGANGAPPAIAQYRPVSQHLALIRFWEQRGRPATLSMAPRGDVRIARQGTDTVAVGGARIGLSRHSIEGVVWGTEFAWTDSAGRLAMFTSADGGLPFKAVRADLVPAIDSLMMVATNASLNELARKSFRIDPIATATGARHLALTGANLIDGNGGVPVRNAVVIVQNGQITAAGPAASTPIPAGARRFDVTGKTIIPGLWDSHAHLNQAEYSPAYLAAGVTTVRDMGNETDWVFWLREHTRFGRALGPSMILAGLVDGPGPNAFGAQSAATPAEGRAIVKRYSALGFDEMKLYDLLAPDVAAAIIDEAHKNQMIVTGHVPRALGLRNAVSAGMDHVAHLSQTLVSDSGASLIAHLVAKKTVMDPMVSWNEIGGHSQSEPMESFQPGARYMPAAFMQTRAAAWGAAVDTATAHQRLGNSLAAIRALHKAGVPIVAGTDMGVPGFSIYRELELYVKAGMTPMEAIRSATAVAARAMNMDRTVGTIAPGRKADLVVLDADPLADISNIRTVRYVMKDGRVYESATLWGMVGVTVPR